jgi:uncharacterized protein (DUF305 family)
MIVFSRSFVRKRVISLLTTAAVGATTLALAHDRTRASHVRGAMPVQYVANRLDYAAEQPPLADNDAAINRMMAETAIKPAGDADRDFVAMMLLHDQGAVDMAKAELRYGHNEQLRGLAQEIVVTRGQEIALMRHALGDDVALPAASSARPGTMVSSMKSDDAASPGAMNMN